MKRIPFILALAVLSGSLWSCGGSGSSSSAENETSSAAGTAAVTTAETSGNEDTTASEKTSAEEETTEAETTEKKTEAVKYKTGDKQFTFEVPGNLRPDDTLLAEECEYCFTADNITAIGISSYSDLHYSAKGFVEGILPDFESKFDEVKAEDTTVNGLPAVKLTASEDKEGIKINTVYYTVQFGNGDLFMLMYSASPVSSYDPEPDVQSIFDSVVYKGEELRTEDEKFSNKSFKCLISNKLFVKSRDDYNVTVKYNLADNMDEYTCSLRISTEKVDDVQEKFDSTYNSWSSHKATKSISKDTAEILGHQAQHIRRSLNVTSVDAISEYYIFKDGSDTTALTFIYAESMEDTFKADISSMLDTFKMRDGNDF